MFSLILEKLSLNCPWYPSYLELRQRIRALENSGSFTIFVVKPPELTFILALFFDSAYSVLTVQLSHSAGFLF